MMKIDLEPYTVRIIKMSALVFACITAVGAATISGIRFMVLEYGPESLVILCGIAALGWVSFWIGKQIVSKQIAREEFMTDVLTQGYVKEYNRKYRR